jgi:FMN phosphatase YigB (HAD superfamily)
MKLAGTETFSTLFVGDSAGSDMGAANAAGVDFVFVRPDPHQPATGPRVLEVESVSDLAEFVERDGMDA